MSGTKRSQAQAPKSCANKKAKVDTECCICYEEGHGFVPCRNGTGCTAILCWKCITQLMNANNPELECPVCRRLYFPPNFTKFYEGTTPPSPDIFAMWRFRYNGIGAEVRMLHDGNIQGQAIVLGHCPSDVSHKAKDIEKLEKYATELGVILSEIDDGDSISMSYTEFDGEAEVLGETEPFKHITKQLQNMGMGYSRVAGIFDFIRLSGKDFKRFLKQGRFF